MAKTSDLANQKISKLLISLAIPTIIAQVVNLLYNIVDRIYIGQMADGTTALGGLSVALPIITLIMAFTQMFGSGGAPLAAIKLGEKDQDGAEKIMTTSFVLLISSGLILTLIVILFKEPLLYLFGADVNTIGYGSEYIAIYALGTIFVQIAIGMNPYINTQGFTKIGMKTVVIGAALNIILDPLFIFYLNLGVKGAAIATVISQAISALFAMRFLIGMDSIIKIRQKYFKIDYQTAGKISALGISLFVMTATESLLQISFNRQLLIYSGTVGVSAMSVLFSINQMISMPLSGLTQGAQPIMSYNYGAKNYDRVKATFKLLFKTCLTLSLVVGAIVTIFPQFFASIFISNDPLALEYTSYALRIYIFGLSIFGAQIACQQSFMALGQAKISLIMALFRKVILLIPLIFILPAVIGNLDVAANLANPISHIVSDASRTFATLLAEPISDIIAAIVTTIMFMRFYHKHLNSLQLVAKNNFTPEQIFANHVRIIKLDIKKLLDTFYPIINGVTV